MFKCHDCGHIFDECEAGTRNEYHSEVPGGAYERFMCCPSCGSDEIEETERCEKCGGAFLPDELLGGYYCDECLRAALDAESFLEFATTGTGNPSEVDTLEDFVFMMIFGLKKAPDESGYSLKAWCKIIYNEAKQRGNILTQTIFKYMDLLPSLWDNFAEYLHEREVKK
jgi:hypothetical protein